MALDKFKNFFSGGEVAEAEEVSTAEYYSEQVVDSSNKMMLLEPRAYSESQQIADYLKNRSAVVVNLKRVTPDQAKRIVDFLQKLGGGIFLCTPNNINVEGKISDDSNPTNKPAKGKKCEKEEAEEEEEEFNW